MKHLFRLSILVIALVLFACKSTQEPVSQTKPTPKPAPAVSVAEPAEYEKTTQPLEISGFESPESVLRHNEFIYISNVGQELAPSQKDSDGYISKLKPDGTIVSRMHFTGLDAPKGMAIFQEVLYVADIDRVVGIDLMSGQIIVQFDFMELGTTFLNDIVVLPYNRLAVSATDINKVFLINLLADPATAIMELEVSQPLHGPNGLWYDNNSSQLYIAGFGKNNSPNGKLYALTVGDGGSEFSILEENYSGHLDGICLFGENSLIFSDWKGFDGPGAMKVLDLSSKEIRDLKLPSEFTGPADFYCDPISKYIWIPAMVEGVVYAFPIDDL